MPNLPPRTVLVLREELPPPVPGVAPVTFLDLIATMLQDPQCEESVSEDSRVLAFPTDLDINSCVHETPHTPTDYNDLLADFVSFRDVIITLRFVTFARPVTATWHDDFRPDTHVIEIFIDPDDERFRSFEALHSLADVSHFPHPGRSAPGTPEPLSESSDDARMAPASSPRDWDATYYSDMSDMHPDEREVEMELMIERALQPGIERSMEEHAQHGRVQNYLERIMEPAVDDNNHRGQGYAEHAIRRFIQQIAQDDRGQDQTEHVMERIIDELAHYVSVQGNPEFDISRLIDQLGRHDRGQNNPEYLYRTGFYKKGGKIAQTEERCPLCGNSTFKPLNYLWDRRADAWSHENYMIHWMDPQRCYHCT